MNETMWQEMDTAPKDEPILATVVGAHGNGREVRIVQWGKTSHVPIWGFCLADQGAEDFDLCEPLAWMPMPLPFVGNKRARE